MVDRSIGTSTSWPSAGVIATAPGLLVEPLPNWILEAQAPVEPLHLGATPAGTHDNVGAQCTTFATANAPFVVALPVPGKPISASRFDQIRGVAESGRLIER